MAKFVPNVLTAEALRKLGIPAEKFNASFEEMMRVGIERLLEYQTASGAWSWYGGSSEDLFMTACVVQGLSECERLGYKVDAVRLKRARERLREMARAEKNLELRAYAAYALGEEYEALLAADSLSPYAQALLVLTLHRAGRPEAAGVARKLAAAAKGDHWETPAWHQKWDDVAVETTGYAIRALAAVDPKHPLIRDAAGWLLAQRQGNRWRSTKDTAVAIGALLQVTELEVLAGAVGADAAAGPPRPKKIGLTLNGAERREVLIDLQNPLKGTFEAHFPAVGAGENRIAFDRLDEHSDLKLDLELAMRVFEEKREPASNGVSVKVEYERPLETLRIGDDIRVTVTVAATDPVDYAMVLSPIPAGCEVVRGSGQGLFERFEARYEKALFFLRSLDATPRRLSYRLRAGFAGRYTVLPAWAGLMYNEEVHGTTAPSGAAVAP